MRVKFMCGLLASIAAGAGSAVAADMPVRPPVVAPVAAPVYVPEWAGFYLGIHGGGGWGHTTIDPGEFEASVITPTIPFTFPNVRSSGGVFGFQFGHNWQWGPVVGGLEIDFSGTDIKGSNTFFETEAFTPFIFNQDHKIEELASARGRLGYLIFPNWLLYGTAGIGWAHERFTLNQVSQPLGLFTETNTTFANEFGWVAGIGLEFKLYNNWLLRGEWLHYDFGRVTHPNLVAPVNGLDEDNFNFRTTVDVARAAISYKFSP
jgi:outer membrane immunogenic protein